MLPTRAPAAQALVRRRAFVGTNAADGDERSPEREQDDGKNHQPA